MHESWTTKKYKNDGWVRYMRDRKRRDSENERWAEGRTEKGTNINVKAETPHLNARLLDATLNVDEKVKRGRRR